MIHDFGFFKVIKVRQSVSVIDAIVEIEFECEFLKNKCMLIVTQIGVTNPRVTKIELYLKEFMTNDARLSLWGRMHGKQVFVDSKIPKTEQFYYEMGEGIEKFLEKLIIRGIIDAS
jgi:hypothetical protein